MADNIPITAGVGTNVATDDIGGTHYQRVKISTGEDGSAVDVSPSSPLPITSLTAIVSGTFNRPADTAAYASGDLVANSTTAGSVTPVALAVARANGETGAIRRVRLTTSKTGLAGTEAFRVHLFTSSPTVANGDNGAFSANGIASGYVGSFEVILDRVFSDGAFGVGVPAHGSEVLFDAGSGTTNLYALIEARGAYTPASGETFTVYAEVLRD